MPVLDFNQFHRKLRIQSYNFNLRENLMSTSEQASGTIIRSSIGERLWYGSTVITPVTIAESRVLQTLVEQIQESDTFFLAYDKNNFQPLNYRQSDGLISATVRMSTPTAGKSLTLSGLPPSYKLSIGDCFSYTFQGVNRMHRITGDATANASGVININVLPALPQGISNNTSVQLLPPRIHAQYVPGSISEMTIGLRKGEGLKFDWIQAFKI